MKYENTKDILPRQLLEEIQKYVAGKVIYVPHKEGQKGLGKTSGYRSGVYHRRKRILCVFLE